MTNAEVPSTTHRRGRRHQSATPRKGDLRESTILEGFEELLMRTSYAALSMDDLARAAGMSRPALYFYFSSKEEVLTTLLERRHAQLMQLVVLPESSMSAERITSALGTYLETWRAQAAIFVTFFEVAMTSPTFGARWRAALGESVPPIAALFDGSRKGSPPAHELVWALLWATQHNMYELFRRGHTPEEEEQLQQTLSYLWLRALGHDDQRRRARSS